MLIASTRRICFYLLAVFSLSITNAFAKDGADSFSSTDTTIGVGFVEEYLKNDRDEIIGAVLKDGKRARFRCRMPEHICHLNERFNPEDNVQVTFKSPPKGEDYPVGLWCLDFKLMKNRV